MYRKAREACDGIFCLSNDVVYFVCVSCCTRLDCSHCDDHCAAENTSSNYFRSAIGWSKRKKVENMLLFGRAAAIANIILDNNWLEIMMTILRDGISAPISNFSQIMCIESTAHIVYPFTLHNPQRRVWGRQILAKIINYSRNGFMVYIAISMLHFGWYPHDVRVFGLMCWKRLSVACRFYVARNKKPQKINNKIIHCFLGWPALSSASIAHENLCASKFCNSIVFH